MQKLGFFEKRRLRKKGRLDAEEGLFTRIRIPQEKPGQADNYEGFSSFMQDELERFNYHRDHMFLRKRFFVRVYKKNHLRLRLMPFCGAIGEIRKQTKDIESEKKLLAENLKNTKERLTEKQTVRSENRNAPEIEALYQKKSVSAEVEFIKKTKIHENRENRLKSEKRRIFEGMRDPMNKDLSHVFARISHYYDSARRVDASIPVKFLDRDTLIKMFDAYPLGEYAKEAETDK